MRFRRVQQEAAIPDMTPMLDIVFIMLIFFIVTTSFVKESGIEWSEQKTSTIEKVDDGTPLLVTIDEFGGVEILGRHIDVLSLRDNVETARIKQVYTAAVVRTHSDAATGILVQAVDQIRLAGISQVIVGKN